MRKILFPTDYSETANNAFRYALHLANNTNSELYVLHVYDPPVISGGISPSLVDKVIKKTNFLKLEQLEANSPILKQIQQEHDLENVQVFFQIKEGLLLPEIFQAISQNDIDFLVMGTEGTNASFHKKILGSNALNAISKVEIPTLIIPKEATYSKLHNVIFTSSLQLEEQSTLDELVDIAQSLGAHIKCVHIKTKKCPDCMEVYKQWKIRYQDKPISFHLFSDENVEKSLLEFIQIEQPVSMVAMIKKDRTFFEELFYKSTTEHLAKHLKVPVFIYKKNKQTNLEKILDL